MGTWTLSFDLKCAKAHWVKVYCQNGSDFRYDIGANTIQATTSFKRYSVTFIPYVYASNVQKSMLAFFSEYDSGAFVTVKNLKLEKGTKATDWTPAPEDRAYLVNTLSPTQADGMWLGSDGKLNITATQIKAGKLQSKDGSSYFDLENGKIVGKNAEMTGSFKATGASTDISLQTAQDNGLSSGELSFKDKSGKYIGTVRVWDSNLTISGKNVTIGPIDEDGTLLPPNFGGSYIRCSRTSAGGQVIKIVGTDGIGLNGPITASSHIRLQNTNQLTGATNGGKQELLAQKSGGNNAVYGLATQTGHTNIYTKSGGQINFYVGTTRIAYIDQNGWHNA